MGSLPEQSLPEDSESPPEPTDRLFFAVLPDVDAAARIARLAQQLRAELELQGRALATERFHIALQHLGDYVAFPQQIVDAARKAASTVTAAPFVLAFDRVASFAGKPRNLPLVLLGGYGLVALTAFQQALGAAMTGAGLGRTASASYKPHLTLLYDSRRIAPQAIEPIAWTVREFVLVQSLIGRSQHVLLARFPLRG